MVITALRALPEHQREVLALYYLADLPVNEVADVLGCAIGHRQVAAQARARGPRGDAGSVGGELRCLSSS